MRTPVKAAVGILSLGVFAATYQAGLANTSTSQSFNASGSTGSVGTSGAAPEANGTTASAAPTSAPSASPSSTAAPAATPATTQAPTPVATKSSSSSSSSSSNSNSNSSNSTTSPGGATKGVSQTSDVIDYRFGSIQLTVTKASGKITDVTLDIAGATGGRQSAFSVLVSAALQANGSNFGNLSGATYTVDAFKQALDSALAKF